jgi:DNA polymerase (family 10)
MVNVYWIPRSSHGTTATYDKLVRKDDKNMAAHNAEIAEMFNQLADLLEIKGDNPFRIRAYRNAARIIAGLSKDVSVLIKQGTDLTDIPGIGKDLAEKIKTIIKTGKLPLLKQIQIKTPPVLTELLKIEGLGPKRVKILYKKLRVKTIADLKKAIQAGKLRRISGFGEKTEQKILAGIQNAKQYSQRIKLSDAMPIAEKIAAYLKSHGAKKVACAGSYRRQKETVGDLDFLAESKQPQKIINQFVQFDDVANIISRGSTRSTIRLRSGMQVDLRVVDNNSYGSALLYFTGSKAHNIALRKIAQQKKLKLNEYGLFKGNKQIAGKTEKEVYAALGLKYIEPELREDRGEIELAKL